MVSHKKSSKSIIEVNVIFGSVIVILFILLIFINDFKLVYWCNLMLYSTFSIYFLAYLTPLLIVGIKKSKNTIKHIYGPFLIILLLGLFLFFFMVLPRDRDIGAAITNSYNDADGTITYISRSSFRYVSATLTIHDNSKKKNIDVEFEHTTLPDIQEGMHIDVKYLPHSHLGMSYKVIQ